MSSLGAPIVIKAKIRRIVLVVVNGKCTGDKVSFEGVQTSNIIEATILGNGSIRHGVKVSIVVGNRHKCIVAGTTNDLTVLVIYRVGTIAIARVTCLAISIRV